MNKYYNKNQGRRVCQEKCVSNQNIIYKIIKELNYNICGICLEI